MLKVRVLNPTVRVAVMVGVCSTSLFAVGALAQSTQIPCPVAADLAGRAYDRASTALGNSDYRVADANKRSFWDIEEYSRNCRKVETWAKNMTLNGLGRSEDLSGNRGVTQNTGVASSGASGTSGANASATSGTSGTSGTHNETTKPPGTEQ
jgi:hypothetical protein